VVADAQSCAAPSACESGRQAYQQTRVAYEVPDRDERSARVDFNCIQHVTVGELGADTTAGGDRPGVLSINILVQLKPENIKLVRAVVRIGDGNDAG
jgi:hypothetical protein